MRYKNGPKLNFFLMPITFIIHHQKFDCNKCQFFLLWAQNIGFDIRVVMDPYNRLLWLYELYHFIAGKFKLKLGQKRKNCETS